MLLGKIAVILVVLFSLNQSEARLRCVDVLKKSSLDLLWNPYGENLVEVPAVFRDPVLNKAFTNEAFREFLLQEAQSNPAAAIKDFKSLADAIPLYGAEGKPWLRVNLSTMGHQSMVNYILKYYRLPPSRVQQEVPPSIIRVAEHPLVAKLQSAKETKNEVLVAEALSEIHQKWIELLRFTPESGRSSLIGLPKPYVVAGGRFRESYFWDSLWIMKGLIRSGYGEVARGMLENFIFLFEAYGTIPNGNRYYYLTRTQVPLLMEMVKLLRSENLLKFELNAGQPRSLEQRTLQVLESFYWKIWKGTPRFDKKYSLFRYSDGAGGEAHPARLVVRPERGLQEPAAHETHAKRVFAESGWDMSYTRFGDRPQDFLPVDLNSILFGYARDLADIFRTLGDGVNARKFETEAEQIRAGMWKHMFHSGFEVLVDFQLSTGKPSEVLTAASFFPFYYRMHPRNNDSRDILRNLFARLKPPGSSGVHTTTKDGKGQWDGSWTWGPLNEIAFQSLLRYGLIKEATELAVDYSVMVIKVFEKEGHFFEKYRAEDGSIKIPEGSEIYGNEKGFGWTNGTFVEFLNYLQANGKMHLVYQKLSGNKEGGNSHPLSEH